MDTIITVVKQSQSQLLLPLVSLTSFLFSLSQPLSLPQPEAIASGYSMTVKMDYCRADQTCRLVSGACMYTYRTRLDQPFSVSKAGTTGVGCKHADMVALTVPLTATSHKISGASNQCIINVAKSIVQQTHMTS